MLLCHLPRSPESIRPRALNPKEEKADKKGEEASGSNSGADPEAMEKDAATSSDSEDIEQKPTQ